MSTLAAGSAIVNASDVCTCCYRACLRDGRSLVGSVLGMRDLSHFLDKGCFVLLSVGCVVFQVSIAAAAS